MSGVGSKDRSRSDTAGNGDESSPLEAVAAGVVTIITLGVAFSLLALGQSYFWVAFPIGFGGGMPLAIGLARWYGSQSETAKSTQEGHSETDTALAALRDRYARGELNDEEFKIRVERLLETESVADAESFVERDAKVSENVGSTSEKEPAANTAEEEY